MSNTGFGAGSALTSGIIVCVKDADDNCLYDITDGIPCSANADWARYAEEVTLYEWSGGW